MFENTYYIELSRILLSSGLFIAALAIVYLLYKIIIRKLKARAQRTKGLADDMIIDLLKVPLLWLCFWILFKIFSSYSFLSDVTFAETLSHINDILLILTVGWILIKSVNILFYRLQSKQDISKEDNLNARSNLTKMKIFEKIIVSIISLISVGVCLMTIDSVKSIGVSLLTSAGIAGIIVGFAAQKSIATVLAGIQIAITQPIRLDDVVIVEGEWGRIEEITLTYVVVKIWDERRLVLPIIYFLEKPFQNWTRNTSQILGTIFLYVDYSLPVDDLRKQLQLYVKDNPRWDGRVANIQVTDAKQNYKELRVLLSGRDSSLNWDLRVEIREKLLDYINANYPDSFVKIRLESVGHPPA
ncbi:mechanosensitive ion channel family protein [Parabacteroides sp. Marseille-P3160]|uniref:mechanosensitive ion channel family protein n=1 Tax=Parabacteroides sp. Marseille-P3160 TaxID=1917887 RepID=UPI000B4157F5|nr:mechanosensitive ion channel domain-containing protein [Parabacteroides sp. Marseille-P3160]